MLLHTGRESTRKISLSIAIVALALSRAALAGDSGVVDAAAEAKNLARMNCGARIECITPAGRVDVVPTASERNEGAAALIMDDQTVSVPLSEGDTTFVISLAKTSTLNRFTFVNENAAAEGDMRIAVSNYQLPAASPKWTAVDGSVAFSRKRIFNLSMVGVEAKYVRISFHVEKAGRVAGFALYGEETLNAFAQRNPGVHKVANTSRSRKAEDTLNYNFANLYARSQVVYVSSGRADLAGRMIDDDVATTFRFSPTDRRPMAIVELAGEAPMHRVSALYNMQPGRLEVYLMNELQTNLNGLNPVASATDNGRSGKAAIDFDPRGARYVAFVWTPETAGSNDGHGFEVAEVAAFGNVTLASLDITVPSDLFVLNQTLPGEGSRDFSNTLGTIAEPPVLAPVSP
jgi:hypothetical protein